MPAETGFWVCLAGTAAYGLLHSILASHWLKRKIEARFGNLARRGYRLFFVSMAGVTLLPVLALPLLLPDARLYAIPLPWTLLTLLIQGLAGLGLLKGVSQTGALDFLGLRQLTQPAPLTAPSEPGRLVVNGMYRTVRHPLYSFSMLILWLMPIVTWNTLALMIGASLYLYIGTYFEERKLRHEFGEAYAEYSRRTPMFIPGLKFPPREG
jgi:methanethiol S-methyltransferase